jgi:hypothetical protein
VTDRGNGTVRISFRDWLTFTGALIVYGIGMASFVLTVTDRIVVLEQQQSGHTSLPWHQPMHDVVEDELKSVNAKLSRVEKKLDSIETELIVRGVIRNGKATKDK